MTDPAELAWLDPPPPGALGSARALLTQLGALDPVGRVTQHGRRMNRFAVHPRLAHMVLQGRALGAGVLACELAALLTERDLLSRDQGVDADIGLRLDLLRGTVARAAVDEDALRRARRRSAPAGIAFPARLLPRETTVCRPACCSPLPTLIGSPSDARVRLDVFCSAAVPAAMFDPQGLAQEDYLVAAELDGRPPESRIRMAAAIRLEEIETHFGPDIVWADELEWDDATRAVVGRRRRLLGAITLEERPHLARTLRRSPASSWEVSDALG